MKKLQKPARPRKATVLLALLASLAAIQSSAAQTWREQWHALAASEIKSKAHPRPLVQCPTKIPLAEADAKLPVGWSLDHRIASALGNEFFIWSVYRDESGNDCVMLRAPARERLTAEQAASLLRAAQVHKALQRRANLAPATGDADEDADADSVTQSPESPAASDAASVAVIEWREPEVYIDQGNPTLRFYPAAALAIIPRPELSQLLVSEPPIDWICEQDGWYLLCSAHSASVPFANRYAVRLNGEALRGKDGRPVAPVAAVIETRRPMLVAELLAVDVGPPQIELRASMPLELDSILSSVELSVDGKQTPFTVVSSRPEPPRRRYYQSDSANAYAWRISLPQGFRAGQVLELHLRTGLRTPSGPLSNETASADGDLLFSLTLPDTLIAEAGRQINAVPALKKSIQIQTHSGWPAHPGLELTTNGPLSAETVREIAAALPAPLRIDGDMVAAYTRPTRTQTTVMHQLAYRVAISGAEPGQRYRMKIDPRWRDLFGRPFQAEELIWDTQPVPQSPLISPDRVAIRPGGEGLSALYAQGWQRVGVAVDYTDPSGETHSVTTGFDLDTGLPSNRLELPLPKDQVLWASSEHPGKEQLSTHQFLPPPVLIAVTELGLHVFMVGDELWAIVTELETGQPVGDAEVSVFESVSVRLRGRTDKRGMLKLPIPNGLETDQLHVLAESADRRAMLGLRAQHQLRLRTVLERSLASNSRFILTDKPLYGPGERVRIAGLAVELADGQWRRSDANRQPLHLLNHPDGQFDVPVITSVSELSGGITAELFLPGRSWDWGYALDQQRGRMGWIYLDTLTYAPWQADPVIEQRALVAGSSVRIGVHLGAATPATYFGLTMYQMPGNGDLLAEHYPGFRFLDPWQRRPDERRCSPTAQWIHATAKIPATNLAGEASSKVLLPTSRCEFVLLGFALRTNLLKGGATTRLLTRHERYLGLSGLDAASITLGAQLTLGAIAAEVETLKSVADVDVTVVITLPGSPQPDSGFQCRLRSGESGNCRWRPALAGNYRIKLTAPNFPDAQFSIRVGDQAAELSGRTEALLSRTKWMHDTDEAARLVLRQPYALGRGLIVLSDDRLRSAHWFDLQPSAKTLKIPPPVASGGCMKAMALIFPSSPLGTVIEPIEHALSEVCWEPPTADLIELSLAKYAKPGSSIRIALRSKQDEPVSAVLSVFEDLSAAIGPSAMQSGDLTLCHQFSSPAQMPTPQLHSVQGAEVWRNEYRQTGRGKAAYNPSRVMLGEGNIRCGKAFERSANSAITDGTMPVPVPRSLLWKPEISLKAGQTEEFTLTLPDTGKHWRVELFAIGAGAEIQQTGVPFEAISETASEKHQSQR